MDCNACVRMSSHFLYTICSNMLDHLLLNQIQPVVIITFFYDFLFDKSKSAICHARLVLMKGQADLVHNITAYAVKECVYFYVFGYDLHDN